MGSKFLNKVIITISIIMVISSVKAFSYDEAASKFTDWVGSSDKEIVEAGLKSFLKDYEKTDYFKTLNQAVKKVNGIQDTETGIVSVCSDGVECIDNLTKVCDDEGKNCTIKLNTKDTQIKDIDSDPRFNYDNIEKKLSYITRKGTDNSILGSDIIDIALMENFLQTAINELGISSEADLNNFKIWLANNKDAIEFEVDDKWLKKLSEIDIDEIIDNIDIDNLKSELSNLGELDNDPDFASLIADIRETLECENSDECMTIGLYEVLQDERYRKYIGWVYEIDNKLGNDKVSTALTKLIKSIYEVYEDNLEIGDVSDKTLEEIIDLIEEKYADLSANEIKAIATDLKEAIEAWLDDLKDSNGKDFLDFKVLKESFLGKLEDSQLQEWLIGQLSILNEYGLGDFLSDPDLKELISKVIVPALENSSGDLADAVEDLLKDLKINKFVLNMKKLATYDNTKDYAEIYSDKNVDVDNTGKDNHLIYFAIAIIFTAIISTLLYIKGKKYL